MFAKVGDRKGEEHQSDFQELTIATALHRSGGFDAVALTPAMVTRRHTRWSLMVLGLG